MLYVVALALPLLTLGTVGSAEDPAPAKKFQATCPLSGGPADEANTLKYLGKTLYFCCPNCHKALLRHPEKYQAEVYYQFAETGQTVQVACPLSGGPVNPETAIKVGNVKVAFCCANCKAKAEKASEEERVTVVFANPAKGFTLQTTCPVGGKEIDPAVKTTFRNQAVYFCCEGCVSSFEGSPEQYLSKLPQFSNVKKD